VLLDLKYVCLCCVIDFLAVDAAHENKEFIIIKSPFGALVVVVVLVAAAATM
jgi:hypothetical protein